MPPQLWSFTVIEITEHGCRIHNKEYKFVLRELVTNIKTLSNRK
jgi:hypothetical protein